MSGICFIGAGKMATAIASGLAKAKSGFTITAYDPSKQACAAFEKASGGKTCLSQAKAVEKADAVLLAVKPQYLADAMKDVKKLIGTRLVISIVAGVTIESLERLTGSKRIIRVMPNTPALAGAGMACLAPAAGASKTDAETAEKIFSAVGKAAFVQEKLLDAVTGLSGSAPAFVLEFIMALADGGVAAGLPRSTALELAKQTVFGTAKLAMDSERHPAQLRDDVISPAGTTAAGVMKLAEGCFSATVAKAVVAAAARSAELGKAK